MPANSQRREEFCLKSQNKTARYKILICEEGNCYRFYCEQSGMAICTSHPIRADTLEKELQIAWETEGRSHFNHCCKCGKWVSDLMFNADTSECVICSPWEDSPNFCPHCGAAITGSHNSVNTEYCPQCGLKLQYKEG